jgi:glycolate oxidase FAD binding subunit
MRAFEGIDTFEPDEGVLHAKAGTPIRAIHDVVAEEGWELALDPPGANSTVGGTLASAATGPRSQAFGPVRDAVLGLDVVGGDGVSSKCGGRVVKNVTGYDLAKLYCGSFGSLGIITGAWLRLRPAPARKRVLVARAPTKRDAFEACRALAGLTSVRALVWQEKPGADRAEVTIELGGSEEGVAHDRERIGRALDVSAAAGDDRMDALRDARAERGGAAVVVRARVLGTECRGIIRRLLAAGLEVSVDPGLGVVHARGRLDERKQLLELRGWAENASGFVTFEVVPNAWREDLDVFGGPEAGDPLLKSLKRRFDPSGILNPGRFAAGI